MKNNVIVPRYNTSTYPTITIPHMDDKLLAGRVFRIGIKNMGNIPINLENNHDMVSHGQLPPHEECIIEIKGPKIPTEK